MFQERLADDLSAAKGESAKLSELLKVMFFYPHSVWRFNATVIFFSTMSLFMFFTIIMFVLYSWIRHPFFFFLLFLEVSIVGSDLDSETKIQLFYISFLLSTLFHFDARLAIFKT